MMTRFKLVAAALGLSLAAGAVGNASAETIVKTHVHRTVVSKTVSVVARPHHRIFVGSRAIHHVRIVHRAPVIVRTVVRHVASPLVVRRVVRITKGPFQHHALLHRTEVKRTIIR